MFYGWYIVAAITVIGIIVGGTTYYGFTAMVGPIAATMGWGYAQIALAMTLRGVESGVMNPIMGAVADRWPAKRLVFLGITILGIGLFLLSQVNSLTMFYVSFLIIGLGGSLGMQVVPTADFDRAPAWMFKSCEFTGLTPGLRFLECEARSVLSGSPTLSHLSFLNWAKEHPIFPHPSYFSTRLVFERIHEVVIAIFGVGSHNVQPLLTFPTRLTQPLDLLNTDFQVSLLAGNPFYI